MTLTLNSISNKFKSLYNLISLRDIVVVFLLNTLGAVLNSLHYLLVGGVSLAHFYNSIGEYIKVYNLLGFALVLSYLLLSPGPDGRLGFWRVLAIGALAFAISLPVSFLIYPWDGRIVHPLLAASSYILGKLLLSAWAVFAIIYIKRREAQLQFQHLRNQIVETTEQRDKAELELHLLQAQLEPHFFFNTLANLHNLIDIDGDKAKLLLEELTSYLRSTIPQFRQRFISLAEELDIVQRYLNIQQIRYGQKLTFSIDTDERAANKPVLPMAVLTLVENAIKHGIEKSRYGGCIDVKAQLDGGRLRISVSDNVAANAAANVSANTAEKATLQPGTGLTNLMARLDKAYGAGATFQISTTPGLTLAQLEFPLDD